MQEPWLRGPIDALHPVASHLIYTFTQAREELATWTEGLADLVWTERAPLASLGFQLRHIAGSVDRLTSYLEERELNADQLAALRAEKSPGAPLPDLLHAVDRQFAQTEAVVRAIAPTQYVLPRFVGRKRLPTTAGGLIIHISEHTQRHLGQAILTAKVLRAG